MNLDHVVALVVGFVAALLLALPFGFVLRRRFWKSRSALETRAKSLQEGWDAERARLNGVAASLAELRHQLETIREERDRFSEACAAEQKTTGMWKGHCVDIVKKHNELVAKYNGLARRFKELVRTAATEQADNRDRIAGLEEENRLLSARELDLQQLRQEVLRENEGLSQENESLKGQSLRLFEEARTLSYQTELLRSQVMDLKRSLGEEMHQGAALRQQVRNLNQTNRALELELAETRNEARALREESDGRARQIEAMQRESEALASQNRRLTQETEALGQEVVDRRRECEEVRADLWRLQDELRMIKVVSSGSNGTCGPRTGADEEEEHQTPVTDRPIALPPWTRSGVVNLGLDFGTYSTKLILQVRNQPNALVVYLDEPTPGYPSFASPSLVRLSPSGRLFFGRQALQRDRGDLFRSLKVSLLPPSMNGGWEQGRFPERTTPDLLVAIYLSWILGRVKDAMGGGKVSLPLLNVAAPMNHLEDSALRERYLHVIHAAWQATFGEDPTTVSQGDELTRLGPRFKAYLESSVPDLKTRRFEVLPETLAPLVSLFQNPRARDGLYLMIDMGAGTTELSTIHLRESSAEWPLACYKDDSILLGGDQFSDNDRRITLGKEAHAREEARLNEELCRVVRKVWYEGFTKEKDASRTLRERWKQLQVILAGGGLRRPGLQERIEAFPPQKNCFPDATEYEVDWHQPADLDFGTCQPPPSSRAEDSQSYLAVAHGLSFERQNWPRFVYPQEVKVLNNESKPEDPYEQPYTHSDVG